jgi:hypothetical protein
MKKRDSNRQRRADRQVQAQVRQELAAKRSPAEQVTSLDGRLGAAQGARRERKRLWDRMKAAASPEASSNSPEPQGKPRKAKKARKATPAPPSGP